jgi:uncharacterized membrane protein
MPETPGWARTGSLGLAGVGLALSIYLTVDHFTTRPMLACPATATVNCEKVTTSQYASVLGIPVAIFGLVFFVAMLALTLPITWRYTWLRPVRLGAAAVGVASVVYLVGVELFGVGAICLWCTAVHVVTFALFAVLVFAAAFDKPTTRIDHGVGRPRSPRS